jgi:hypothetical protein
MGAMIAPSLLAAQDADKKVAGGGDLAPGWQMRIDPNATSGAPPKFVAMGNGFHATSGARAIYWRPADVGSGNYKVEATFTLTKPPGHAESYGLIFAGKDLTAANQNYFYFTLGGYPDPLRITEGNRRVTENACRTCHAEITEAIDYAAPGSVTPVRLTARGDAGAPMSPPHDAGTAAREPISCIRCHRYVGHWVR